MKNSIAREITRELIATNRMARADNKESQDIVERLTDAERYAAAAKAPTIRYDLAQDGSIAEKLDPKIVWLADAVLALSETIRALLEKQNG